MDTGYLDKLATGKKITAGNPYFTPAEIKPDTNGKGNFNFRNLVTVKPGSIQSTIASLQSKKKTLTDEINTLSDIKTKAEGDKSILKALYDKYVVTEKIYDTNGPFLMAYDQIVRNQVPYLDEAAFAANNAVKLLTIQYGNPNGGPEPTRYLFDQYKSVRLGDTSTWNTEILGGFSSDWQGCDSSNRGWKNIKSCTPLRTYQMGLVFGYLDDLKRQIDLITNYISGPGGIDAKIKTKFDTITDYDKQISKLLNEEKEASEQRIKENLTNPEYIKAKQAYDMAILDSQRKAKRNLYVFVGGVIVVGAIAAVLLIPSKK